MNSNEHIGPQIKAIHNSLNQHLCKVGEQLNLTSAQMHVLKYLLCHQNEIIYQKNILNEFELSNATVSGIISRLKSKGFVTCSYSGTDSRCKQIKLTKQALNYERKIQQNIENVESEMLLGFSDDEISTLHQYLDRIFHNLNLKSN